MNYLDEHYIQLVLDGMFIAVEVANDRFRGIVFKPKLACSEIEIENCLDADEIREISTELQRRANARWN